MRYFRGFVEKRPERPYLETLLKFKWEWAVEYSIFVDSIFVSESHWTTKIELFETRHEARQYKASLSRSIDRICNIKMKRRLAQVNWEDYNDSFKWNNGCGKRH